MTDRPGDTITVDGRELLLLVRQQTRRGVWWALDDGGKAHSVERDGDGWKWYDAD